MVTDREKTGAGLKRGAMSRCGPGRNTTQERDCQEKGREEDVGGWANLEKYQGRGGLASLRLNDLQPKREPEKKDP